MANIGCHLGIHSIRHMAGYIPLDGTYADIARNHRGCGCCTGCGNIAFLFIFSSGVQKVAVLAGNHRGFTCIFADCFR